jgi:hypothetical protein
LLGRAVFETELPSQSHEQENLQNFRIEALGGAVPGVIHVNTDVQQ